MTNEPSQDPDWERIYAMTDGAPSDDELEQARRDGAEAMLDAIVRSCVPKTRKAWDGWVSGGVAKGVGVRLLTLLHMRRHPVLGHIGTRTHLAEVADVKWFALHRITGGICKELGVPMGIDKGQRRRVGHKVKP